MSLTIDLSDADCKTKDVSVEINKQVDDKSWENVLNSIGTASGDSEWQLKYFICSTKDTKGAVIETGKDLAQLLAASDDKTVLFVQVQ